MVESAKRHKENSNLIKEIPASTDAAIKNQNQGASIKDLEIQIRQMNKVLQEWGSRNLPSSTEINPRDHVKSILTTVDADTTPIRHIGSSRYAISVPQNSKLFFKPRQMTIPFPSHLYNDCYDDEEGSYGLKDLDANSIGATLLDDALPTKEKDPGSFTLPCIIDNLCFNNALADLGASVSVMTFSTYTKLRLGELAPTKYIFELVDRTMKRPKELRRNQVDDLEPTIEEGEVVDEPIMDIVKTRCYDEMFDGLDEYPSYCDFDRKSISTVLIISSFLA
ncbi:hypothetical protein Tco_1014248 [Tanacetum coccineum]